MITSTVDPDSSTESLNTADEKNATNREEQNTSRRYMDAVNSLGRALNLDRRDSRRERRVGKVVQYIGPARRKIIDRRDSPGDRRKQRGQA